MNGLQRTMLGTLMAGATLLGAGSLTGCQKQQGRPELPGFGKYDSTIPNTELRDTVFSSNRSGKYVVVHDTIYIPPKPKYDIKIPRLTDLVEEARKPAMEFVENGLKLLRKIK